MRLEVVRWSSVHFQTAAINNESLKLKPLIKTVGNTSSWAYWICKTIFKRTKCSPRLKENKGSLVFHFKRTVFQKRPILSRVIIRRVKTSHVEWRWFVICGNNQFQINLSSIMYQMEKLIDTCSASLPRFCFHQENVLIHRRIPTRAKIKIYKIRIFSDWLRDTWMESDLDF